MARPRGRGARRAQTSIYETTLENPELEEQLKAREARKSELSTARQNFETSDKAAQALIDKIELGEDAAVRVGDFVISQKLGKAGHVEFERKASLRTRIRKLDE